jgi:hypothetical protein
MIYSLKMKERRCRPSSDLSWLISLRTGDGTPTALAVTIVYRDRLLSNEPRQRYMGFMKINPDFGGREESLASDNARWSDLDSLPRR